MFLACHAERSAVSILWAHMLIGAESKHPENVIGIHAASRRSHETARRELPESVIAIDTVSGSFDLPSLLVSLGRAQDDSSQYSPPPLSCARFSNRVERLMNASFTTPVGPLRCLAIISSALPSRSGSSGL